MKCLDYNTSIIIDGAIELILNYTKVMFFKRIFYYLFNILSILDSERSEECIDFTVMCGFFFLIFDFVIHLI